MFSLIERFAKKKTTDRVIASYDDRKTAVEVAKRLVDGHGNGDYYIVKKEGSVIPVYCGKTDRRSRANAGGGTR